MHGLLVINKPAGVSSRAVVDAVEGWFPGVRVGHAGTLDPAATGVLVLCLGRATRLVEYVQRMPKTYEATIRLGARSDTDDAAGRVDLIPNPPTPTEAEVRACVSSFVGEIEQVPPAHSAARVDGRRAYVRARRGEEVALPPRHVRIYQITLARYDFPLLHLTIDCGKGTYIRALARDLGERLSAGGLLQSLTRVRIGAFLLTDALPHDAGSASARKRLLPMRAAVAELPGLTVDAAQALALRHGKRLKLPESPAASAESELAVFDAAGELVAIALWSPTERTIRAVKTFAPADAS